MQALRTLLAGCAFFAITATSVPTCKRDNVPGYCNPTLKSSNTLVDNYDDLQVNTDVGLYGGINYVDWRVATAPANSLLTTPSGNNYITAGPGGPLKLGQVQWRVPDNPGDVLDIMISSLSYSCSAPGGSPAVPCTIRLDWQSSQAWGSPRQTVDLVYTPNRAPNSQNSFSTYSFTYNNVFRGFTYVTITLLSAANPSQTQINFDVLNYGVNHYG